MYIRDRSLVMGRGGGGNKSKEGEGPVKFYLYENGERKRF